ncbi:MAG: hypothetical protein ACLQU4_21525 [Limisphaerales bacterium]
MRPDFIEQLRDRLAELGCPKSQARRLVREVAEHREDLKQAASLEGLSDVEAEARVNAKLGDPRYLAEQQMAMLRRSSWLSRHSVIGFCLLPLLAVPVLWGLLVVLELWLEFALGYGCDEMKLHVAANNPAQLHHLATAVCCSDCAAIALVALLLCWLARRAAVSLTWMMVSLGICSLYALFTSVQLNPHSVVAGFSWPPQWIKAVMPLLIASVIYILRWRTAAHENGGRTEAQ